MSVHTGPPGKVRPPVIEAGGREDEQQRAAGGTSTFTVADPVPLYRSPEFDALDPNDPRHWQSTVRAADAWYAEGSDEAIRARVLSEFEAADRLAERLCILRLRQLSYDLSAATDWTARAAAWKPAGEWARLRTYEAPAPRQGQPWTAAELDKANWREGVA